MHLLFQNVDIEVKKMGLFTNETCKYHHKPNIHMSVNTWENTGKRKARLKILNHTVILKNFGKPPLLRCGRAIGF